MAAGAPSNVTTNTKDWISLAQRIQAIAQTGLAYATGPNDVERYTERRHRRFHDRRAGARKNCAGQGTLRRRAGLRDTESGRACRGIRRESPASGALSLTRILPEQIRFVFDCLRNPEAPTAFD
jgi:hypothetical protein